jgi:hypothetical protein
MARAKTTKDNSNGATLGFEAKLWLAADKLRNNMDAAEYKHRMVGLTFLSGLKLSLGGMERRNAASRDPTGQCGSHYKPHSGHGAPTILLHGGFDWLLSR